MMPPLLSADSRRLQPGKLWSVADVINSNVSSLCALGSQLMLEEMMRENAADELLGSDEIEHVQGWLKIALLVAKDFDMSGVRTRVELIRKQIGFGITQHRVSMEFRVLRETLHSELKGHLIYRYPAHEAAVLKAWQTDWAPALGGFPSAEADIKAAVDLWALYHSTASVYHLMRVLEHGLKALATDLGKTFDIQNWQNILDEIEAEIRNQAKALPRGVAKSDRLRFLSEAAKEFHFFKDGWRNHVSHNRAVYDHYQARSVMDHVRSFMNGLSSQLSEE